MELQTSRQKVVLYDNTTSPLPFLGPGSRHDFIVQHDIKELGIHNLICSTVYTAAGGERRYTPETFKFTSANPLYVKTKVSFKSYVLMQSDLPHAAAPPDQHLAPPYDLVRLFQPLHISCCCLHTPVGAHAVIVRTRSHCQGMLREMGVGTAHGAPLAIWSGLSKQWNNRSPVVLNSASLAFLVLDGCCCCHAHAHVCRTSFSAVDIDTAFHAD